MYRIDTAGSVAAAPAPAALGTEGFFRDGISGSFDGTVVDEDWLNNLQETILNLLDDQSIAHSKTLFTGLTLAVASKIAADTPAIVVANVDAHAVIPLPIATTAVSGIAELATILESEGNAGDRVLTPSGLGGTLTRLTTTDGHWDLPGGVFRFQWARYAAIKSLDVVTLPVDFNVGDGLNWACYGGQVSGGINRGSHFKPESNNTAKFLLDSGSTVPAQIFGIGRK